MVEQNMFWRTDSIQKSEKISKKASKMKFVAALAILCTVTAIVVAEECRDTGDCDHVTCPEADYVLECHERQCTCTHTTATCTRVGDCSGNCDRDWHCIDGRCRCGFGFGGK